MSTRTRGRESARRRGSILVAVGVVWALAFAGVACATSDVTLGSVTDDGGNKLNGEGGAQDEPDVSTSDAGPDSLPPPRECSDQNFCHTNVPEGATLTSVWGDGAGVVWSVSAQGTIYRWDGFQWKVHHVVAAAAGAAELTTIWGSSATDVWVAGSTGLLHGTGTSAATLSFAPVTDLPGNPDVPLASVWGSGPDNIWAVGYAQDEETACAPRARRALRGRVGGVDRNIDQRPS